MIKHHEFTNIFYFKINLVYVLMGLAAIASLAPVPIWAAPHEAVSELSASVKELGDENYRSLLHPLLGVSVSNYSGAGYRPTWGLATGFLADLGRRRWIAETGLIFLQQGATLESRGRTYTQNYLGLPLWGKYKPFMSNAAAFYLRSGLTTQYLLSVSSRASFARAGVYRADLTSEDRWDVAAVFGLGTEIFIEQYSWFIDLLASRGLIALKRDDVALYNQSLVLATGIGF